MANDTKYGGKSRGLWRKIYGYQVNKPSTVTFIDLANAVTRSIDLNNLLRHRDFFKIPGILSQTLSPFALAEYDEGLIFLSGTDVGTGSFSITFSGVPIVVLTPESASFWGENVQVYGFQRTTTQFTFGTSAPYSGTIRYRAIYRSSYPAGITSIYTASAQASAATASVDSVDVYTASYADLTFIPTLFLQTAWNISGGLHDISFVTSTVAPSSASVDMSAPLSGTIDFIAFYSV